MKKSLFKYLLVFLLFTISLGYPENISFAGTTAEETTVVVSSATSETPDPNASVDPSPSDTPETPSVTNTTPATPTITPEVFARPLVVITGYAGSSSKIHAGKTVDVTLTVKNQGSSDASNLVISFTSGDLVARGTGGVQAIPVLRAGELATISQNLTAASSVTGKDVASITVTVSYTDGSGNSYTSDAALAFNVSATATPEGDSSYYATATPTSSKRPQIVISAYQPDVNPLQPGTSFQLMLEMKNVGSTTAKNITMVMGGGNPPATGTESGTPAAGGVAGAGGEFTNFAPIGSSNIQTLGNLSAGETARASQQLIVNVTTNPGTYPVKFSYLYADDTGHQYQDDQVITLLVYRLPQVEVNFYRTVDPLTVGMPGTLPIQIVNLSRNSIILGNMTVSTGAGEVSNNVILIGNLDPGGSYPLDVNFIPNTPGPAEIQVTVQYMDDFNQPRQVEFKLSTSVEEAMATPENPELQGNGDNLGAGSGPETFWQKVVRLVKGLFGLDSSPVEPTQTEPIPPSDGGGGGGAYPGGKGSQPGVPFLG